MAKWFGFNFPFIGGKENILSRQEDDRLIKNDLLQLLFTSISERVMRPTFGTPLRTSVFEPLDDNGVSTLKSQITEAINLNENRVDIVTLDMSPQKDKNLLDIKLIVRMKSNPSILLSVDASVPMGSA